MIIKKFLSDDSGVTVAVETILLFAISVIFLGMIYYSFHDMSQRESKVLMEEELLTIGNGIAKQMSDLTVEARASQRAGSHTIISSEFQIPVSIADSAYKVTLMAGKIILESTSSPYISVEVPVNIDMNLAENSTLYSNDEKHTIEYDSKSSAIYFGDGGVVPPADFNAPTISIDAPPEGYTISNMTSINTTPYDENGVARVKFYVNGIYRYTAGPPWYWLWDTRGEVDGNYTVTAVAYDAAGHTKPASRNYTVSNPFSFAPVITIIYPLDGENTTFKKPIIKAVITDDKELNFSSIKLVIDTKDQTSNATFTNVPIKKSTLIYMPSQNMNIGLHNVEIRAKDVNATPNETVVTWTFNITEITADAANPSAEIVSPTGFPPLEPGSTITVSYVAYDIGDSGLENLTINVRRGDGFLYTYQENISVYPYVVYQIDPQETWANNSNKYAGGTNYTYNITVFDRVGKQSAIFSVGPINVALPGQASELEVNTSSVTKSANDLQNIKLKDNVSDSVSVSIIKVNISWSVTGQQIQRVRFDGSTYWRNTGGYTPAGKQNSGTLLTLGSTYTAASTFKNMEIQLSSDVVSGETFTIVFHLSDTTTRTVTFTAP